jgi:hypothetical protein
MEATENLEDMKKTLQDHPEATQNKSKSTMLV